MSLLPEIYAQALINNTQPELPEIIPTKNGITTSHDIDNTQVLPE